MLVLKKKVYCPRKKAFSIKNPALGVIAATGCVAGAASILGFFGPVMALLLWILQCSNERIRGFDLFLTI